MSRRVETAFLPAALEIQETPPSPAGRAVLWAIMSFFVLALVWAWAGEADIVAIAQGRIIPTGHSKTVQPLEIGTVRAIHVAEGQGVRAGEVLIELDPSRARADVDRIRDEIDAARRESDRLQRLAEWLAEESEPGPEVLPGLDPLLLSRWREHRDRLDTLARELDSKRAERDAARRQVDKLSQVLPIVARRAAGRKELADKHMLPEQQYLETEQQRLEIYHDLRTARGRVARLAADMEQLTARMRYARSEYRRQLYEQLEQAERRLSASQKELVKANARLDAQTIVAPVAGVVQQLAVHNVGAVVTPAQELMIIVPRDRRLEVEAVVENRDIGFVRVGQAAEIKIDAFPFTKYGTIAGEIVDLSNDAVADERRGLVYKMRVLMERSDLMVDGREVALTPGMTVSVEARTGTRRLIEFFLSPLLRYADESVRER